MPEPAFEPIAIIGMAAIMPDAPTADQFWANLKGGRYSIRDVPPERWDPALYYDPDPRVPDKTYSKIGGWVREYPWDPVAWKLPVPPKVAEQLDGGQRWAVSGARTALLDAGWPGWDVDPERVAVILGNAIGGEKHYRSNLRIELPEVLRDLIAAPSFAALPEATRAAILDETRKSFYANFFDITEDTMPGELANVMAGRIANLFNFRGPNFTTDAACASGLAAVWSAAQGLASHQYDAAVTGGIDRNMGVAAFVKFCKIGALSATGTRPFDAGADGFVMGEGASVFVLKRLADAERAGDRIHAVLLGIAGSSDGKGKGITAPNPVGQRIAIEQAWRQSGVDPATVSAIEAHGTSTRVGDAAELESLTSVFGPAGARIHSVALGSVKSNIGHLKAGAGTAGLFKMAKMLAEKVLVPSLHFEQPNPNVDWDTSPFAVNTALRSWPDAPDGVRRGGVSAFGFGGTNFHAVLEEFVPGRHKAQPQVFAAAELPRASEQPPGTAAAGPAAVPAAAPPARGALVIGGDSDAAVRAQLEQYAAGTTQPPARPDPAVADAAVRLAIDFADPAELATKAGKAVRAFASGDAAMWRMLRAQGVFLGRGPAPRVAFLYPGQGSQYVNMLADLRAREPIVAATFDEADAIMAPLLGKPLSEYVFADPSDPAAMAGLEGQLLQTEITQPAVLTVDVALTRLLAAHGVRPDFVMGHSLGEYAALVAAGSLDFDAALEAVSARGREMAELTVADKGAMAAVFGPLADIERIVAAGDGYVVVANVNSLSQAVIGGATVAVEQAIERCRAAGMTAQPIPVSHAFHTAIVAPASAPLQAVLRRLQVRPPELPVVANVTGEFYPADIDTDGMIDVLSRQVASPVQFVQGLRTLYAAGARLFVEVGPKKALHGFAEDVLGSVHDDVLALFTNHPKTGGDASFNQALCGLYASGLGMRPAAGDRPRPRPTPSAPARPAGSATPAPPAAPAVAPIAAQNETRTTVDTDTYVELGRIFADFLDRGRAVYEHAPASGRPDGTTSAEPVVVTGAALGLPGVERVFDDDNIARILEGQQFIDAIPHRFRQEMVDKHITRLVKPESGDPVFVTIDSEADVVKLAGRHAPFDLVAEFGVDESRDAALDSTSRLAIGAGIDALRDAGIPLVMHYRTTTLDTKLPDRWGLPEELRDDTGVIFASAFPGYGEFAHDLRAYTTDWCRRHELASLEAVRARLTAGEPAAADVDHRITELRHLLEAEPFTFDRRFIFRALAMGHAQFAELIGARGPNTQINAACASTTQAMCVAEDWIRTGRAKRVVIVTADDVTNDELLPWVASGFLASGAAATDDVVADAAVPFDRRRHGMIVGMGAAAFVVEAAGEARARGVQPICEIIGAVTANSAYHGTRLDVTHVGQVMERVVQQAERRGHDRAAMAAAMVFVSHETYTPARGGSASAEVNALRHTFGASADRIVVANTKGFTGHAMGAGIEDVVAVKSLETGIVPPVPNFREPDPELGTLNLSTGGAYPVEYALRLAAGFGSQIAMTILRWTPLPDRRRADPHTLGYRNRIADAAVWQRWLARVAGHDQPELEVVQHRLRIVDRGAVPSSPNGASAPATPETLPSAAPVAVPAAAPAPAPAVTDERLAATAADGAAGDPVVDAVVSIVSEMTGYPRDLLALDLDLEADLGVDTVKQAEVFAAVRERFGLARDEVLKLRDFPTLTHVIGWVRERTAAPHAAPSADRPAAPPSPDGAAAPAPQDAVVDAVVSIVSEMTGYPRELLDLDLDLEADLGVDTVKQAEVFAAVRERFALARDEVLKLRDFPTLTHVIGWVRERTAAPAVSPAAPAAPEAGTEGEAGDAVTDAVVSVAAEMTGYPRELLDLDLDLEADLGVDTVKQAEMFAAVRERFGVARDDNLKLRNFPTLNHVIGWVRERTASATAAATPSAQPDATGTPAPAAHTAQPDGAGTRFPRRVPVPVLRPDAARCGRSGVTLETGRRVVVMPDGGGVGERLVEQLRERGVETLELAPAASAKKLEQALTAWRSEGPIDGVYWLTALDDEGPLDQLDLPGWREALRRRVKNLYTTMRATYETSPFLITATRLGGYLGYDDAGATAPLGGAVSGFAKAYHRERPAALVKVVDFAVDVPAATVASDLLTETEHDPGCVEIGHAVDGTRWTIRLCEEPFAAAETAFGPDSVFVITGAAGSIVSAITADLAASGGTFHLLDLTPAPGPDEPDIARFRSDKDALKLDIADRLTAAKKRPTPVAIERELARIERLAAARSAIDAVTAAGGTARYHQVDLTDSDAVTAAVDTIKTSSGRIDVLVHAAGLEISTSLPDKQPREFDLVFDVKSDGWFNLLHAAADLPIGATVAFSSVAGRFGNAGQTDYAAANDLLCKIASSLRRTRPATRALAIDWTAWAGIGMATRGSIPRLMELAGVEMLDPEIGVPWVRRELETGGRGEVVVAGALGTMAAERVAEPAAEPAAVAASGPMIGTVTVQPDGIAVFTTLVPRAEPFLDHHRIDGTPVLPGVMGVEAFTEAAALLAPGWHVSAVENVDFLTPVKFYRDEPRTITVRASGRRDGADLVVDCTLTAERELPGSAEPQLTTHFTGSVRLTSSPPAAEHGAPLTEPASTVAKEPVYQLYFHGPAYQVVDRTWQDESGSYGRLAADLPADHSGAAPLSARPRLVELCFQTAGLWEAAQHGRLALPQHVDRVGLVAGSGDLPGAAAGAVHASARPGESGFDCVVRAADGTTLVTVAGYRTVELPVPVAEPVRRALTSSQVVSA